MYFTTGLGQLLWVLKNWKNNNNKKVLEYNLLKYHKDRLACVNMAYI